MTGPSPRSIYPVAFSAGEAVAGGSLTLAAYLVVSVIWYWLAGLVSMGGAGMGEAWVWATFVWIYGAMMALPAAILGTATAALLGRAMRRRASFPLHLLVQAANAYVIGAFATFVFLLIWGEPADWSAALVYPFAWGGPAAAIAALVGWRSIVAIAQRRDARRRSPLAAA